MVRTDDVQPRNVGIGQPVVLHGGANSKCDFRNRILGADQQHAQRTTEHVRPKQWTT
jgi:hypothetical protein